MQELREEQSQEENIRNCSRKQKDLGELNQDLQESLMRLRFTQERMPITDENFEKEIIERFG